MRAKVVKSDPPETKEILAESIVRISEAFTQLQSSGLNRKAIVVDALRQLKGWYCR